MEKFLKVLKVNVLSLIALPLLLIATASKLIAKALEKVAVILSMLFLTIMLVLGFEFFKSPGSNFQAILYIVIFCAIFFVIIAIFVILMHLAAAVVVAIWSGIIGFFESIYDWTYTGFLRLYASCENDYQYINLNGQKVLNAFLCLFYTILRIINKLIVTVISFALPASIILSVLLVAGSLLSAHSRVKDTFGIGLFDFIGKFDTYSKVYGIVMYVALIAMFVIVLMSLGIEWYEWAKELKLTSEELSEDIADLRKNELRLRQSEEEDSETEDAYMKNLEEHMANIESLGDLVEEVLATKDNALLRSTWGNYFRNLSDIVDECSKYRQGIPMDKFKRLVPRIQQLEKQREEVKNMALKLQEINNDPVKASVFFAGCNTAEKLEKRYKSLCKAYHPDAEGGDTETFQRMQEEYAALKEYMAEEE